MRRLEQCSYGLDCPIESRDSYRVFEELGAWMMFFDTQMNRRLSTTTQGTKGRQSIFSVSSKQVEPVKYSRQQAPQCNSLSGPSKRETRVDLFTVPRTCFMLLGIIFKVDRLGQTSSGHPSGKNFENIHEPTRSSEQGVFFWRLESFVKLIGQDEPRQVNQVEKLQRYPKPTRASEQGALHKDWSNF